MGGGGIGQGGRQMGGSGMIMPSAWAGVGDEAKAKAEAKSKRVIRATIVRFMGTILL
jgi:hypothetical protein